MLHTQHSLERQSPGSHLGLSRFSKRAAPSQRMGSVPGCPQGTKPCQGQRTCRGGRSEGEHMWRDPLPRVFVMTAGVKENGLVFQWKRRRQAGLRQELGKNAL